MSKHTPAPWSRSWIYGALRHVSRNVDSDSFWFPEQEEDRETANIPSFYTKGDVDLITAAPELLEALKLALVELGGNDPNDLAFEDAICGRIRQAIAKAEGKV